MSPAPDNTLADPQQIIADLRRANGELQRKLDERTAERDGALARETATAEVLGIINSSPGDLVPVFDAILEKAMTLCGAALGEFHTFDGGGFHLAALRGGSAEYAALRAKTSLSGRQGTVSGRVLGTKKTVHIPDLK